MATYYSSLYADQAEGGISTYDSQFKSDPRLSHGRVRVNFASITVASGWATATNFAFATMKGSDRILQCWFECGDIGATNADLDIGVHNVLSNGDIGAAGSAASIADDLDISSAVTWADLMSITTRGKQVYELAGAGASADSQYIISGTTATAATDAAGTINVAIYYTAGD